MILRTIAGIAATLLLATAMTSLFSGDGDETAVVSPERLTQSPLAAEATAPPDSEAAPHSVDTASTTAYVTTTAAGAPGAPQGTVDTTSTTTVTTKPPATSSTTTTTTVAGGDYNSSLEAQFVALINDHRADQGLAPLTRSGSLDSEARAWSKQMASEGEIFHSDLGRLLGPWSSVGENVAVGGSVTGLFNALVASDGHNANMLGDFTHIGVGVWVDAGGTLWTTHLFAK